MNVDLELEAWREQWQAAAGVPADLRRKVVRGTNAMRMTLVLEGIVTVMIGGGSTLWAVVDPRTEMVVLALAVSYALTRHLPAMPLNTAIIVLVFGSLTLLLHDEHFIKLKPTIIYVLFGAVLLSGLALGKPLLGMVFDSVFQLTEEGWRKLTLRWALFFFALAVLNEIVWRSQSTDVWVSFKVFGVVPLTFVFAALQYPLLTKYAVPEKTEER